MGGNGRLGEYLARYGLEDAPIQDKYRSVAAAAYRRAVGSLVGGQTGGQTPRARANA